MKIKTETQTGSIVSFKYDNEIAEITGLSTSFEPSQDGTPSMHTETGNMVSFDGIEETNIYDVKADIAPVQDLHGYTKPWAGGNGKNKLPVTETSTTRNGVTFTINADGTIATSGTATSDTFFYITANAENYLVTGQEYVLNGCPAGGGSSMYGIEILYGRDPVAWARDIGNGVTFTATDSTNLRTEIFVVSGQNVNGLVFKPMIRLASETDASFEPYFNECPISGWDDAEVTRTGKNLLPLPSSTISDSGLTVTVVDNNKIHVQGTTNRSYAINLHSLFLKAGVSYTLTGGSEELALRIYGNSSFGGYLGRDTGNGFTFTPTESKNYYCAIGFENNVPLNKDVYPMIRFADISDATYEPYNGNTFTIDLNGTRYGGTLDVTKGVMNVTHGFYTVTGNESGVWTLNNVDPSRQLVYKNMKSYLVGVKETGGREATARFNLFPTADAQTAALVGYAYVDNGYMNMVFSANRFATADEVAAWLQSNNVEVVYELATPLTVQLTPTQIEALVGENNIWADTGDVTVTYGDVYPISGWDEVKAYVSPTEEEEDATIYTINLNGTRYGGNIDFFSGVMTLNMVDVDLDTLAWWRTSGHRFQSTNLNGVIKVPASGSMPNMVCSIYSVFTASDTPTTLYGITCFRDSGTDYLRVIDQNYDDVASFKQMLTDTNAQLAYELAEPIEVQLTAEQIEALQGQNNVWADCGDITLTWRHIPVLSEAVMLNGKYLELTIDGYSTLGTSGRRSLGRHLDTFSVGTADGETVKNSTFPSRKITVNYVIQTDTEEELTDAINQLANILNQKECDFIFRDEQDKFFSGYGLLDSEPKKYRHAVKGTWTIYCAYPFKRSVETTELVSTESAIVEDYAATFEFNYNGTLPARPILRAEFASNKSGGDYSEDGDCGFVAFVDPSKNIIQLGNPDIVDLDQYEQYANETLVNSVFDALTGWTASGITVGSIADQFWNNGAGQTQNYAKGTGALYRSVTGSVNFDFSMVHRLCVNGEGETGKFEALAKNGNDIVAGFRIEKTGNGTSGTVYYILNNKEVGKDVIDLSYYNTNFGYCKRDPVYVDRYGWYDPFDPFYDPYWYVSPIHRHDPFYSKRTRQVQKGWSYTQSNLNSRINKNGKVVTFTIGTLAQRTFKSSDIEFSPATTVTFNLDGGFNTNAVRSAKFTKGAGTTFSNVPNVFTAGDIVEADCNSADVTMYRAGSIEGRLEPKYGALGNDWEQFVIRPGTNIIRAVWSNWVDTDYKPEIRIIFNEVYL